MAKPMKVIGIEQFIEYVNNRPKQTKNTFEGHVRKIAQIVLEKAQYYCPVDTTDLKYSGKIVSKKRSDTEIEFVCSFGKTSKPPTKKGQTPKKNPANYVIYVHEDLTKYHAPPTSAKFLQRGYDETDAERKAIMRTILTEIVNERRAKHYADNYRTVINTELLQ